MICSQCGADPAYDDPCPKDPDACPLVERSRRHFAKMLNFPARYGSLGQPPRPRSRPSETKPDYCNPECSQDHAHIEPEWRADAVSNPRNPGNAGSLLPSPAVQDNQGSRGFL
jgi:hypothetical protein